MTPSREHLRDVNTTTGNLSNVPLGLIINGGNGLASPGCNFIWDGISVFVLIKRAYFFVI